MIHTEFSIRNLMTTLRERSMKDSTPKKFAVPMFEACEVIKQLMDERTRLQHENDELKAELRGEDDDRK